MQNTDCRHIDWPYPVEWEKESELTSDVLVLGGGVAGCWAAIAAARRGVSVILVEKGATIRSGAGGSGCDHWESAATNPCSKVTPEELTDAMIRDNDGYNNGISHYIECREGYDRLLDLEKMGAKIRDTENEFKGAPFRDKDTRFLFAYDYTNRFTLRVWGSTFKPALYRECLRLGIRIMDRVTATSLFSENGKPGGRVIGAAGVHARTGEWLLFRSKAVILCMSRPARIWLFSPGLPGISEFRPPQCIGDGHAMAWRAGAEFTMMEKSVKAEWSGERSFPPYSTGNTHNTWYACSMVDVEGKELPWVDRDGRVLETIDQRYRPAPGQKFFIKGGNESDFPNYDTIGPDLMPVDRLLESGYKLPFYADLGGMPEHERRAIWGLMVGEEGKTKIPILAAYHRSGFDPKRHLLQSYGHGWKSGGFLPQERQLFGLPGGLVNDWRLRTNLEGLYAAGDQLFASNCHGHAAATGYYAGRQASDFAKRTSQTRIVRKQAEAERDRVFSPARKNSGISWKELNSGISRIMQHYCGEIKSEELLSAGLSHLKRIGESEALSLYARNPHELMRSLEVLSILTNAEIVIHACRARKAGARQLHFVRSDFPQMDPPEWKKFITVKQEDGKIITGDMPLDYYGSLPENYARFSQANPTGLKEPKQ